MATYDNSIAPFEGPEKLLEVWFAPFASAVPATPNHPDAVRDNPKRTGLRAVERRVWEDMLDIVKCKVLSVVNGDQIDAYLLSESSLFVFPHKLILKTCGTTLNLLGLPRILAIANNICNMPKVWRCFYSRKSFMFPERQSGPHRDWSAEVDYLDELFKPSGGGAAYTVGKVNGDHWLLYMTTPHPPDSNIELEQDLLPGGNEPEDYTIELLMTDLAAGARDAFFANGALDNGEPGVEQAHGIALSKQLGITSIFPESATTLDAYSFMPCGYSANALVAFPPNEQTQHASSEEGYYTIHVTPEEGWSYASFESNVQLAEEGSGNRRKSGARMPDLQTLVQRVVKVFQPGRLSLTLFVSAPGSPPPSPISDAPSIATSGPSSTADPDELVESSNALQPQRVAPARSDTSATVTKPHVTVDLEDLFPEGQVDRAQRAFLHALGSCGYRRTDKINYEFGGYDLAFASFELKKPRPSVT